MAWTLQHLHLYAVVIELMRKVVIPLATKTLHALHATLHPNPLALYMHG